MKIMTASVVTGLAAIPVSAGSMDLAIEIPRLQVAEYHQPYIAVWIENEQRKAVANLDVWYDVDMRNDEGEKWLADMRLWWRRAGRSLDMPVDGVSGPTQGPGIHKMTYREGTRPLKALAPGNYKLIVEAAREVGGRETVSIPFQWPPRANQTLKGEGKEELKTVSLTVKP